jgi:hypothetical protein
LSFLSVVGARSFAIGNLLFGTRFGANFVVLSGIFVGSVVLRRKIGVGLVVSENCSLRVVWYNIFELWVVLYRIFTLRVQVRVAGDVKDERRVETARQAKCGPENAV